MNKQQSETGILPETTTHSQYMLTELGVPDHFYLAPGCYRTAPATNQDWQYNGDDI